MTVYKGVRPLFLVKSTTFQTWKLRRFRASFYSQRRQRSSQADLPETRKGAGVHTIPTLQTLRDFSCAMLKEPSCTIEALNFNDVQLYPVSSFVAVSRRMPPPLPCRRYME